MHEHRRASAFVVGIISAAGVLIFIFVGFNKLLAAISVIGPVIASLFNVLLRLRSSENAFPLFVFRIRADE